MDVPLSWGSLWPEKEILEEAEPVHAHNNVRTQHDGTSRHRAGHTMGDFPKRTSQGNGKRKRGSYKLARQKALPRPRSLIPTPEFL